MRTSLSLTAYLLLLSIVLSLVGATVPSSASLPYADLTCKQLKTSRGLMEEINNAKMLALGNHECVETYIKFWPNQTVQLTLTYPSIVNSFYDSNTGSVHSDYTPAGQPATAIDEYWNGQQGACITVQDSPYFIESIDGNKGDVGTAWRAVPFYTKDAKKDIRALQWIIPVKFKDVNKRGDVLSVTYLDANNKIDYIVTQTCTVV